MDSDAVTVRVGAMPDKTILAGAQHQMIILKWKAIFWKTIFGDQLDGKLYIYIGNQKDAKGIFLISLFQYRYLPL